MLKLTASLLAIAALFYIGACAYLYVNQRAFLYFPTPPMETREAETLLLKSGDETLRVWRTGPAGGHAVIFFGGNAQDVSQLIPVLSRALPDHAVYLVNYRGYGGSTGAPSEAALFKDAAVIYDALKPKHATVSVVGQSLGSGVAVYLAAERQVDRLVLITPYDSIENVARKNFPAFPVSLILKDKFASSARAGGIRAPTLVMLAERDEVIPLSHSETLVAAFRQTRPEVKTIKGTGHNTIWEPEHSTRLLRQFFRERGTHS